MSLQSQRGGYYRLSVVRKSILPFCGMSLFIGLPNNPYVFLFAIFKKLLSVLLCSVFVSII